MVLSNPILLPFNLILSHPVLNCLVYFLSNGNLTHACDKMHIQLKLTPLVQMIKNKDSTKNCCVSFTHHKNPNHWPNSYRCLYCLWRVSETTRASSDVYCQSNNDNFTRTSCAFYEKSLQVNHRQNTQKERARYCGIGREGERRDRERERV
jgi:hypothetical protein